jgi:hypothetical protein
VGGGEVCGVERGRDRELGCEAVGWNNHYRGIERESFA